MPPSYVNVLTWLERSRISWLLESNLIDFTIRCLMLFMWSWKIPDPKWQVINYIKSIKIWLLASWLLHSRLLTFEKDASQKRLFALHWSKLKKTTAEFVLYVVIPFWVVKFKVKRDWLPTFIFCTHTTSSCYAFRAQQQHLLESYLNLHCSLLLLPYSHKSYQTATIWLASAIFHLIWPLKV